LFFFFFFKQKTAYEIRACDWSSDVCSSDLASAICNDAQHLLWVARRAALKTGCRVLISAANPRDFNALLAQSQGVGGEKS